MENNNLSGEKKPEMITDKNGNSFVLEGNVRSGKTKAFKQYFEKSMHEASEKLKDLLDKQSDKFKTDMIQLNGITDLNFIENLDDNKPINHKYEGLIKLYPDEKIWLQTISTEKSL